MGRSITSGQIFLVCFHVGIKYKSTFMVPPPDGITTKVRKENSKIALTMLFLTQSIDARIMRISFNLSTTSKYTQSAMLLELYSFTSIDYSWNIIGSYKDL